MEMRKYTNPVYYRPGTSGSKETKQDYEQQRTKYNNHNKIKSKVVQMEECFSECKILMVIANQTNKY